MRQNKSIIFLVLTLLFVSGCASNDVVKVEEAINDTNIKEISVGACDLSGKREANVKVNIGYNDVDIKRNYYAYTNEYGQVVKVTADKLILQTKDEANKDGRYCKDEAKVKGTESKDYDEGHIIADSLGGVSNAYNITPQKSSVNRKGGSQYKLEEEFRSILSNHGDITDLSVIIDYDNNQTQTPTKYKFSWKQNGSKRNLEFENK